MWITVRTFDGSQKAIIRDLSKLTKIEDLRTKIADVLNAPVSHQVLYFGGKQLVDGHTLFDYNVGLEQTVQVMIRAPIKKSIDAEKNNVLNDKHEDSSEGHLINKENESEVSSSDDFCKLTQTKYFKVGDYVDAKDKNHGAWFEGKIISINVSPSSNNVMQNIENTHDTNFLNDSLNKTPNDDNEDNFLYTVSYENNVDNVDEESLPIDRIRPRARVNLNYDDIDIGDVVMVSYNVDDPDERGFWYDCMVTKKEGRRTSKYLIGTIFLGSENTELHDCKIKYVDGEVFAVEKAIPISERKAEMATECDIPLRPVLSVCKACNDNVEVKCKECSCRVCGGKDEPRMQILCDECNYAYHIWCLQPPLATLPDEDDWYCPDCKNDENEVVKPGEKLKASKKKAQMASHSSTSKRDWGKGMACAGRTKECTIVPPNHFGPIPGVEVGSMWMYRVQVSECGIHRPHVAGIHGRENHGAYSIVLSGGYEDDLDNGNEFKYTGSGGRNLSGNKRTADQSCDQTLTRMNKALALNCAAAFNKSGADAAKNWKTGKPVRVVRNAKGGKHSKYAPEEGNRYDGLYKVVKYWPEKGKSGFLVWRYLLRRDDPIPAPWTKAGKERIESLGLVMQYPEGYVKPEDDKSKKGKRPQTENSTPNKKAKLQYALPKATRDLINKDSANKKLWQDCLKCTEEGKSKFLDMVKEQFTCICCVEVVYNPITTNCCHNICKSCLRRSFKAGVHSCPMCRTDLGKDYLFKVNQTLQDILLELFPGYTGGR